MRPGACCWFGAVGVWRTTGLLEGQHWAHLSSELRTHTEDVLWTFLWQCILPRPCPQDISSLCFKTLLWGSHPSPECRDSPIFPRTWYLSDHCIYYPDLLLVHQGSTSAPRSMAWSCSFEFPCEGLTPSRSLQELLK